jgi:hypothetical protein
MRTEKYDYWVVVDELIPPLGENNFFAKAEIHEIGKGKADHNLGEIYGKTREEAHAKMDTMARQWIQVNEKS